MNVALDQAQERLARARARVEQITADREHYEGERKHAFLEELRALGDANERGAKVIELRVEVPSPVLIPGFDLVSGADDALLDDADGCILLTDDRGDTKVDLSTAIEKLHPITPRALRGANVHELPRVLDRMAMDHPLVVGTRAIERAAPCIARAIENSSLAERTSRTRIDALERQRIMNPADFRSRSLARVEKASREAADEIARGAVSSLKEAIADLRKEWTTAINTAASRGAVEAVVKIVNEEAQMRVVHIVDAANGRIASELQRASDTMQTWLLEELRVRCEVVRRESMPERVGVLAEPIEELTFRPPLSSVLEKFERKRVDIGMGGAAAGGTLIVPGIGTAIGAFAGTFAGLFKGLDSLKRDCIQKLEVSLHMVERHLREQIDALPPRFACAIQASLEEALDQALARFERSITHLLDLERRTLATEQAKLQRLSELRSVLADHDARFKQLAKRAGEMARSMYAARK
jgi:exonuclease VII small subunit